MKVFLGAIGCRLNEAELASWAHALPKIGGEVVETPEEAEILVFNSCTVTRDAARKSRNFARRYLKHEVPVVVTGCHAELEPADFEEMGVQVVLGNNEKDQLLDALQRLAERHQLKPSASTTTPSLLSRRTRAFLKVQDGCNNRCAYCVVTLARGAERSRPLAEVLSEVEVLLQQGVNEIVLAGVHLGGYGRDIGTSLKELVETLLARTAVPRLRLGSVEPWEIPDDFFTLWQDPRFGRHLHLPLQSGSETLLKRMRRRNTAASFAGLVARARKEVPGINITTDLIVGFPGESEEEWRESLCFVEAQRFGHIHLFSFSARPGTHAAKLPGQHPKKVKRARYEEARQLMTRIKRETLKERLGERHLVLWEGEGKTVENQRQFWGYTDNYFRVEVRTEETKTLENTFAKVSLEEVIAGKWLRGELVQD